MEKYQVTALVLYRGRWHRKSISRKAVSPEQAIKLAKDDWCGSYPGCTFKEVRVVKYSYLPKPY
jgi:hypothetical protein